MGMLMLLSLPSAIVLLVVGRRSRLGPTEAREHLGLTLGTGRGWRDAALLALPLFGAAWLVFALTAERALNTPGVVIAQVTGVAAVLGVLARALGEEIFFRGLLGGVLVRRLGLWAGNSVQAAIFLLPHLPLLALDPRLWPILPVQFATGWLLGWVRHRSGSVLPGAAVHGAVNLLVGLIAA